jgi:hypothetical protein
MGWSTYDKPIVSMVNIGYVNTSFDPTAGLAPWPPAPAAFITSKTA